MHRYIYIRAYWITIRNYKINNIQTFRIITICFWFLKCRVINSVEKNLRKYLNIFNFCIFLFLHFCIFPSRFPSLYNPDIGHFYWFKFNIFIVLWTWLLHPHPHGQFLKNIVICSTLPYYNEGQLLVLGTGTKPCKKDKYCWLRM